MQWKQINYFSSGVNGKEVFGNQTRLFNWNQNQYQKQWDQIRYWIKMHFWDGRNNFDWSENDLIVMSDWNHFDIGLFLKQQEQWKI